MRIHRVTPNDGDQMDKNPKVKWKLVRTMLYKAFNEILAVSAKEEGVWRYLRVFGSSRYTASILPNSYIAA